MSLEERFYALMRQHELMFGESLVAPNKRCSKCRGLGHTPSVYPNKAIVTLAEWEAAMEEENEEEQKAYFIKFQKENQEEDEKRAKEGEKPLLERVSSDYQTDEDELEETLEETVAEANEGQVLTLDIPHPPKGKEHHGLLFISFGEAPEFFPTPPSPKTLKSNFCQPISEPLLNAPNSELRVLKEVVQRKIKESHTSTIQTSKGKGKKRVSKFKRDLFSWLILFQPEMKQEEEFFT